VLALFRAVAVAWGADEEAWKNWAVASRKVLVKRQNFEGRGAACASGSWAAVSEVDQPLGPIALTALNLICQEICYAYLNNLCGAQLPVK